MGDTASATAVSAAWTSRGQGGHCIIETTGQLWSVSQHAGRGTCNGQAGSENCTNAPVSVCRMSDNCMESACDDVVN